MIEAHDLEYVTFSLPLCYYYNCCPTMLNIYNSKANNILGHDEESKRDTLKPAMSSPQIIVTHFTDLESVGADKGDAVGEDDDDNDAPDNDLSSVCDVSNCDVSKNIIIDLPNLKSELPKFQLQVGKAFLGSTASELCCCKWVLSKYSACTPYVKLSRHPLFQVLCRVM